MPTEYDVIVVGAGIVGLTLACILAKHQCRVAILEARPHCFPVEGTIDSRVSAITLGSQRIFESAGIWHAMQHQRISPFDKMFVWDASGEGKIHFDCATLQEKHLGFIIENSVMQKVLLKKLETLTHVDFLCPAELASFEKSPPFIKGGELRSPPALIHVTLKSGKKLKAKLLVGADGAHSTVRRLAEISQTTWEYGQEAIVCTVKTALDHQRTAWQRFLTTGPLAFLPLSDPHVSSIVWSTTPLHAQALCAMEKGEFARVLGEAFEFRLGNIEEVGERFRFPLTLRYAQAYVQPRIALVGDAIHTFHPLAGQGVNVGLADAKVLADIIIAAKHKDRDYGSYFVLRRYERSRKGEHVAMIALMEGFVRLFGTSFPLLASARNIGLNIFDNLSLLKNTCMRYMM